MTEEREHHLVLADQLIQQGDPRGELAVIQDRIFEAHRTKDQPTLERLLPQARAIIEADLSKWVGFDVEVETVRVDLDGSLNIGLRGGQLLTMRWGVIDSWYHFDHSDLARLEQLCDRPAVRLRGFGLAGLHPGNLTQILEARAFEAIVDVHVSGSAINSDDVDALARWPLRSFAAVACSGLDDDALVRIGAR